MDDALFLEYDRQGRFFNFLLLFLRRFLTFFEQYPDQLQLGIYLGVIRELEEFDRWVLTTAMTLVESRYPGPSLKIDYTQNLLTSNQTLLLTVISII